MKVFLTGATGFIGSRVLNKLLEAGHEVTALVRQPDAADRLKVRGVNCVFGDLTSLDLISQSAKEADAALHLAFIHDFKDYAGACKTDSAVSVAILTALEGTGKPFVATSGSMLCGDTGESPAKEGQAAHGPRVDCEQTVLKGAQQGVRTAVMRLPLYVYDESVWCSFMADVQVQAAKKAGAASYINSGMQKVSVAHVEDAAAAYVAAMHHGVAGATYNVASEQGVRQQQIAQAISQKLSTADGPLPVGSISMEEASAIFPPMMAQYFSFNNDLDTTRARTDLKWSPQRTSGFTAVLAKAGSS